MVFSAVKVWIHLGSWMELEGIQVSVFNLPQQSICTIFQTKVIQFNKGKPFYSHVAIHKKQPNFPQNCSLQRDPKFVLSQYKKELL